MRVLKIALLHFKIMIKDKKVIGFMFLMPLLVTAFITYLISNNSSSANYNIGLVINDSGSYGNKLADYIKESEKDFYSVRIYSDEEAAKDKIKTGKLTSLLVVDENFSSDIERGEKPQVQLFKSEGENISFKITEVVDAFINKSILDEGLKRSINLERDTINNPVEVRIDGGDYGFDYSKFVLVFIVSFIVFSANTIAYEIFAQRKDRVLKRQLVTPNEPWEITGGLLLGFGLIEEVIYISIINILKVMFKLDFGVSIWALIIPMTAMIMFSISLGLFVVRVTSNEGLISIIINIIGVAMGFVSGSFTNNNIPGFLKVFSRLTPQYWFNEAAGGSNIIVCTMVILLIAAVFFTAGSLKFTSFLKE